MIFLYAGLYHILFLPTFWLLSFFNAKIARGFQLRQSVNGVKPWLNFTANSQPIWFHASSMEFEYAKPVIRELKARFPKVKILVTFFSPSAESACRNFPGVDFASPSPWDTSAAVKEFIDFHRPRALLLARTDTWPQMLSYCREQKIPVLLFSSTFAAGSRRNHWSVRGFYRFVFSLISQIFAVSEEDVQNYSALGINSQKMGDTRYDQVLFRLEHPKPIKAELLPPLKDGVTLVAGSTWPEDETQILEISDAYHAKVARLILVPHEPSPEHLTEIKKLLVQKSLPYVLYSEWHRPLQAGEVLIVDQVGILAELYAHADIAFIGGSFRKNVHSVMEALACGCLTLVGPFHQNNREAMEFKKIVLRQKYENINFFAVSPCSTFVDIEDTTRFFNSLSTTERLNIKNEIRALVRTKVGATQKVIEWISSTGKLG